MQRVTSRRFLQKMLSCGVVGGILLMGNGIDSGECVDTPVISEIQIRPQAGPHETAITIALRIQGCPGSARTQETLHLIREEREQIRVPLFDDGTHGDAHARDGFYTGRLTVPPTASQGKHRFVAFVEDHHGKQSNHLTFEFEVTDKVPITHQ